MVTCLRCVGREHVEAYFCCASRQGSSSSPTFFANSIFCSYVSTSNFQEGPTMSYRRAFTTGTLGEHWKACKASNKHNFKVRQPQQGFKHQRIIFWAFCNAFCNQQCPGYGLGVSRVCVQQGSGLGIWFQQGPGVWVQGLSAWRIITAGNYDGGLW